jgi:transcriptional regulator with GAF, ATPase, and Fis domain
MLLLRKQKQSSGHSGKLTVAKKGGSGSMTQYFLEHPIEMNVSVPVTARYQALLDVNKAAITQSTADKVFENMCAALKPLVLFDRAGLTLYEPEQDALKLVARQGKFANSYFSLGVLLGRKESHDGWMIEHGVPIIRRDVETERQFAVEERSLAEGLHSYCAVPLMLRGESIGVVTLLSRRKNQFSHRHAEFLQQAANQIVLAIRSFNPRCAQHSHTRLICPRCIASRGGQKTTTKYKDYLSNWGKKGGRGRKKPGT